MTTTILNKMKRSVTLLLTFLSVSVYGQDLTVSGTLTSGEDQQPMIGVNVVIRGTTLGASTDYNGSYTIQAPSDAILEFSFIGFITQSIPVDGRTHIDVTLQTDKKLLEDVIVVGYKKEIKSNVSSAISSVKAKNIEHLPLHRHGPGFTGTGSRCPGNTGNRSSGRRHRSADQGCRYI